MHILFLQINLQIVLLEDYDMNKVNVQFVNLFQDPTHF